MFLLSLFFVGGWLHQSDVAEVDFDPASRVLVISSAGPVTIVEGPDLRLTHRDSWLLNAPRIEWESDDDELIVRLTCPGRLPCRSSAEITVPTSSELVLVVDGHSAHLESFDGEVTVYGSGEDTIVTMGAVSGSGRVVSSGDLVRGFGVQLSHLDVEAASARVDLAFDSPPNGLVVNGGENPVSLVLPEEEYEIGVVTAADRYRAGLDNVPGAERHVSVEADGLVQISPVAR